jgi:hypothetical protein
VPAITSRRAVWLTVAVVGVVFVVGCGGRSATSTAAPTLSTSTLPTTTTIPQLSGEEVAWLDGLTKLKERLEKKAMQILSVAGGGFTPELMVLYGKALGSCSRELARLGSPPSDRLQPVYALAKKACQQFSKAQRCHATVARLSNFGGGVLSGSPQERPWKRASDCASAAEEKGRTLLAEAEAKGVEINLSLGGG